MRKEAFFLLILLSIGSWAEIPEWAYKGSDSYVRFIEKIDEYLVNNGKYAFSIDKNNGIITVLSSETEGLQIKNSLYRIYKKCMGTYIGNWDAEFDKYFASLIIGAKEERNVKSNLHNYDFVKKYLRISVINKHAQVSDSFEIFDQIGDVLKYVLIKLPVSNYLLDKETIALWGIEKSVIVNDAEKNTMDELLEHDLFKVSELKKGIVEYKHFRLDYDDRLFSSLGMCNRYLDEISGQKGVLIVIPNVFEVSLYSLDNLLDAYSFFDKEAWFNLKEFSEGKNSLSPTPFWYYKGKFHVIEYRFDNSDFKIVLPEIMKDIFQVY